MKILEQFNKVAGDYDKNRKKFVPCYEDFYENSTKFIIANIPAPQKIIDLGAGTGLLSYHWSEHCPDARFTLVDVAEEMLKIAKQRFHDSKNMTYQLMDYAEELPPDSFDAAISALSIHHLADDDKQKLFKRLYDRLSPGGLFVNYDQFRAEQTEMDNWYNSYWESQILNSGLTGEDVAAWRERKKLDRECSVGQEIKMLRDSRFNVVSCIFTCQKFSVLVAIK